MRAAAELARDYGGYVAGGDLGDDGHRDGGARGAGWSTLTLAVPAAQFDGAHNAVLSLGKLIREDISGKPLGGATYQDSGSAYSYITIHFWQAARSVGRPSFGWNPARTFEQAFGWFVSIFTVLADVIIWVVVVGGPFVLMGWGVVALWRRLRGKR